MMTNLHGLIRKQERYYWRKY